MNYEECAQIQAPPYFEAKTWMTYLILIGIKSILSFTEDRAPLLMASTNTKTERSRKDQRVTVCVCSSIILKYRFQHMSLLHKIIGLLLYGVSENKMVNLIT